MSQVVPAEESEFRRFWAAHAEQPLLGRNKILAGICPQLHGLFLVKLAMALMLIGGVAQQDPQTAARCRGELHMLLVGDPGTGALVSDPCITGLSLQYCCRSRLVGSHRCYVPWAAHCEREVQHSAKYSIPIQWHSDRPPCNMLDIMLLTEPWRAQPREVTMFEVGGQAGAAFRDDQRHGRERSRADSDCDAGRPALGAGGWRARECSHSAISVSCRMMAPC